MQTQAANDPNRKGILVPLGQDRSKQLLQPVPGLLPSAIHRRYQRVLTWRPHLDFPSCLPDGIKCPCCKTCTLSVQDAITRNVRLVMARDGTIFMIGCAYKCKGCAGGASLASERRFVGQQESCRASSEVGWASSAVALTCSFQGLKSTTDNLSLLLHLPACVCVQPGSRRPRQPPTAASPSGSAA
jgi:hypothetical protein